MHLTNDRSSLNQTGALLLAEAMRQVFPQSKLIGMGLKQGGFYCEVVFNGGFQKEFLQLIENGIKEASQKIKEVSVLEMIAKNGAEFLAHKGEKNLAATVRELPGIVKVVQLPHCVAIAEEEFEEFEKLKHFTLFEYVETGDLVRIEGRAFYDPRELKVFLKKTREYSKNNHFSIAQEKKLYFFEQDFCFWQPKGIQLRQLLMEKWRLFGQSEGFAEVQIPDGEEGTYQQITGEKKFCEWKLRENSEEDFFPSNEVLTDSFFEFCLPAQIGQKCISSLQLIIKFSKLFSFEYEWVLVPSRYKKGNEILQNALESCKVPFAIDKIGAEKSRIELHSGDGIGRFWPTAELEIRKDGVVFSLFGSLERFIALMLENGKGELPFWLIPEQVRLFPLEGVDPKELIKILNELKIRFFLDQENIPLGEKMHRALQAKVPYVMVFGKREEKAGLVTVRAGDTKYEETIPLEQMKQLLVERKDQI